KTWNYYERNGIYNWRLKTEGKWSFAIRMDEGDGGQRAKRGSERDTAACYVAVGYVGARATAAPST
ncbi:hypothetical protein RUM43_000469, partial [Polyplax serrata]